MGEAATIAALAAPLVQIVAMGFVGYPLARRTPERMAAFRNSGFTWWLGTLMLLTLATALLLPSYLRPTSPSAHTVTLTRLVATLSVGLAVLAAVEALAAAVDRHSESPAAQAARDRFDSALPQWARASWSSEALVLATTALLEEALYRGVALSGLLVAFGLEKPVAAGIVAVAFGAAHWYFGIRMVLSRTLAGAVLCAAALSSGWVAAACVHACLNIALAHRERRAALGGGTEAAP